MTFKTDASCQDVVHQGTLSVQQPLAPIICPNLTITRRRLHMVKNYQEGRKKFNSSNITFMVKDILWKHNL